jgi:predicted amino acid-binding ACT domain protein
MSFFVIQKSLDLTKVLLQNGYEILRVKVEQTVFDHRFKYAKQSVQNTQNEQQG